MTRAGRTTSAQPQLARHNWQVTRTATLHRKRQLYTMNTLITMDIARLMHPLRSRQQSLRQPRAARSRLAGATALETDGKGQEDGQNKGDDCCSHSPAPYLRRSRPASRCRVGHLLLDVEVTGEHAVNNPSTNGETPQGRACYVGSRRPGNTLQPTLRDSGQSMQKGRLRMSAPQRCAQAAHRALGTHFGVQPRSCRMVERTPCNKPRRGTCQCLVLPQLRHTYRKR